MNFSKTITLVGVLLCLTPALVLAQTDCPAIVQQAMSAVDSACQDTGRNEACYGNVQLTAQAQPGVSNFTFNQVGDIANVADIQSLRLNPMNTTAGTWGVAMLRLQTNLPDTLPGQNVTFLLFGDVQIDNAVQPGDSQYNPMQAFYFKSGVGDAPCEDAPESGLMVQTPQGSGQVLFNINGVDIEMGSTVYFQSNTSGDDSEFTVNTLEGAAYVHQGGQRRLAIAGTRLRLKALRRLGRPTTATPVPESTPTVSSGDDLDVGEPYNDQAFHALPVRLLQRKIKVHAALARNQIAELIARRRAGKPLCGDDPLPSCDHLPPEFGGRLLKPADMPLNHLPCIVRLNANQQLPAGAKRPFCDQLPQAEQDKLPCFVRASRDQTAPEGDDRPYCDQVFNPIRRLRNRLGSQQK